MTTRNARIVIWLLAGVLLTLIVWSAFWGRIFVPLLIVLIGLWLLPFAAQKLGLPTPDLDVYNPPPALARRAAHAKRIGKITFFGSIFFFFAVVAGAKMLGWTSLFVALPIPITGLLGAFIGLGYQMFGSFIEYKGVRQNVREKKKREQSQKSIQ